MQKRQLGSLICVVLLMLFSVKAYAQQTPDIGDFTVQAKGAIVMDASSGRVLFAQSATRQLAMASTTKIMSALLTLEQPGGDEYFMVDSDAILVEGSSMGLQEGDQVNLRTLAYGMLLPSGNDAANAAAVRIGGSISGFVRMMNARAEEIGMENTHFATPSGLDAEEHYSTAYDMALLTKEALQNEAFKEICSSYKAKVEYGNPPYLRTLTNHNRLLTLYQPAIGVKTGFTDKARRCLVSAAEKDGITLIVVTLNAADDFNLHKDLYERYFNRLEWEDLTDLLCDLQVPVAGGEEPYVLGIPTTAMEAPLLEGEWETLKVVVQSANFLYAPTAKDAIIGAVQLRDKNEQVVYESPLRAARAVDIDPHNLGLWGKLVRWAQKR